MIIFNTAINNITYNLLHCFGKKNVQVLATEIKKKKEQSFWKRNIITKCVCVN